LGERFAERIARAGIQAQGDEIGERYGTVGAGKTGYIVRYLQQYTYINITCDIDDAP
jgi:hypothetical protein